MGVDKEKENTTEEQKQDGFKDEQYFIIPTESFEEYCRHPLVKAMYLTDVGFFPKAHHHFMEREEGAEEYILLYCVEGEGYIRVENKKYHLHRQEVFCIPKNRKHQYYADEEQPWSIFWVHFKGENTDCYPLEDCRVIRMNSLHAENRIITLFDVLFRVLSCNYTLGNFIYISQVLSLILSEIYFREKVDEASQQNRHITTTVRYMYRHLDQELKLEDLAEELQLSKSYINASFKKYTGRAPIDFFINLKMQEACKLLKATELYICEIGQKLGYDDPYYFSRIFKKVIGVSPKEYRNGSYVQR